MAERPNRQPVRGPTSALSSFLRERGITVPTNPYARINRDQQQTENTEPSNEPAASEQPAPVTESSKSKKKITKKKKDDDIPIPKKKRKVQPDPHSISGLLRICQHCTRRFLIPTSTSEITECTACRTIKSSKSSSGLAKKTKRKTEDTVIEYTGGLDGMILPLRDLCIKFITERIDDVEVLSVPRQTKTTIARILSRQRQINASNLGLFLGADEDEVKIFDCTCTFIFNLDLDEDSLISIPMLSPNLQVFKHIGERCGDLRSLTLTGAYLPTSKGFVALFKHLPKLEQLRLEFAVKLDNNSLKSLAENCKDLQVLYLKDCERVSELGIKELELLHHLNQLHLIGIGKVETQTIQKLLENIGHQLTHLSLDNHPTLTSDITSTIYTKCNILRSISLQDCPELIQDTDKLNEMFTKLSGLTSVDLRYNPELGDDPVVVIANMHGDTIEQLFLNKMELSPTTMQLIVNKCTGLIECDFSWIRCVDDFILADLLKLDKLKIVKIFGCNKVTRYVLDKEWRNKSDRRIMIYGNEYD
ncbi:hypothetical protein HDV06_006496 [Boothiomyces sp. JEL0866]|nr:hypothetical protein HDV06_006496 [Boothiomyces sp. JEL0866]